MPDSEKHHGTSTPERLARIEAIVASQQREQSRQSSILERISETLSQLSMASKDVERLTGEISALNRDWGLASEESERERRKIWDHMHEMDKRMGERMSKAESDIRDIRTYAKAYIAGIAVAAGALAFMGSFVAQIIGG